MKILPDPKNSAILNRYVSFVCLITIIMGFAVLLGWLFNLEILKSLLPGLATMKPLTAIAFLFLGGALWGLRNGAVRAEKQRVGFIFASIATAIGGLVLVEYIFQIELGIDGWLFRGAVFQENVLHPGRPAPSTALGLFLCGLALLTLRRKSLGLTNALTFPVLLLATLALVGYVFGVDSLYKIGAYTSIAVHSAVLLLLISVGILIVFPEHKLIVILTTPLAGGVLARRLIPAAILVPFVLAWIRLQGELIDLYDNRFGLALYATSNITVFIGLVLLTAQYLNRLDLERQANLDILKQSEERFSTTFHTSPAGLTITSISDGKFIDVNNSFLQMLEYTREEVIGHTSLELNMLKADQRAKFIKILREQGRVTNAELAMSTKSDKPVQMLFSTEMINLHNEVYAFATILDVTEQKQAQQQFALAVESAPNAILIMDSHGRITLVNHQAEKIFGYAREELIDAGIDDLVPERFRKYHSGVRKGFTANPQTRAMGVGRDLFALRKDGSEFPVEIGLTPIEIRSELHVMATVVDITERKHAEKEHIANLLLETKNAELNRFSYTVSHDLNAPLATIRGYLAYVRKDIETNNVERTRADLKRMDDAVLKMQELLSGVLALSQAGLITKKSEKINFNELVHETLELLGGSIKLNKVEITVQPDLPFVLGDRLRLRQVLQNLIENAIKYRDTHRPLSIEIGMRENSEKDQSIFYVRDNGIGIEKKYQEVMFELFSQADANVEGSGVGLAIVQQIIQAHGGKVWVESEKGQGATFFFRLPAPPESS